VSLSRRDLLAGAAAGSALVLLRPTGVAARSLASGASRATHLREYRGLTVVQGDLHNHTFLSDGEGDPAGAFGAMRAAAVDVAALTDHATMAQGVPTCGDCHTIREPLTGDGSTPNHLLGINEASWQRLRALADDAHVDGRYVALRGFEWSSPTLGHMNVWFSERYTDPAHTVGLEETTGMRLFYDWLDRDPATPALEGGSDGIAGFNHPGREAGRFGQFVYDAGIAERVVSIEVFNRGEDYLFEGVADGRVSPIAQCLNAGWTVGLIGVSDHHGSGWGSQPEKGRAGLWVRQLTRAGVREAMLARRFFATVEPGLRLAATANGAPMGSGAPRDPRRPAEIVLDLEGASAAPGRLNVQVLGAGEPLPSILAEFTLPGEGRHKLRVHTGDSPWVLLRVSDLDGHDERAAGTPYDAFGRAIAYTSPWFFTDMAPEGHPPGHHHHH
jgi:hypothetical protein